MKGTPAPPRIKPDPKATHDALRKAQKAEREASSRQANDELNRVWGGVADSLAELIRMEAKEDRGGILPALLRNWRLACEWEATVERSLGGRASVETIGTVLDFFASESAWELRRAVCGTTPADPDEHQVASAWVDGRLVISLPFHLAPSNKESFLVVDPPAAGG